MNRLLFYGGALAHLSVSFLHLPNTYGGGWQEALLLGLGGLSFSVACRLAHVMLEMTEHEPAGVT